MTPPPDLLTVLLVRHAEPVLPSTPGFEEDDRPLTERGRRDAAALAGALEHLKLEAVYCSPYPRAVETVEPSARRRGLPVEIVPELRERLLSPVSLPDWRDHLERAWLDFDYAPEGGETGRVAQARAMAVLETIRARHPRGTVMLGGHGNLIALTLHALEPKVDYAFWAAIPMPAVYALEHDAGGWRVAWGPGF